MSTGNKMILLAGIAAGGVIAILVIANVLFVPEGLVEETDPGADRVASTEAEQWDWVDSAHKPVMEVTDESFASAVLASDRPVLVDFWATWCGPCVEMAPVVERFAEEYSQVFRVAKLDVDQNPQMAKKYEVDALPTLVLFRDGEETHRIIGLQSMEELVGELQEHLAPEAE